MVPASPKAPTTVPPSECLLRCGNGMNLRLTHPGAPVTAVHGIGPRCRWTFEAAASAAESSDLKVVTIKHGFFGRRLCVASDTGAVTTVSADTDVEPDELFVLSTGTDTSSDSAVSHDKPPALYSVTTLTGVDAFTVAQSHRRGEGTEGDSAKTFACSLSVVQGPVWRHPESGGGATAAACRGGVGGCAGDMDSNREMKAFMRDMHCQRMRGDAPPGMGGMAGGMCCAMGGSGDHMMDMRMRMMMRMGMWRGMHGGMRHGGGCGGGRMFHGRHGAPRGEDAADGTDAARAAAAGEGAWRQMDGVPQPLKDDVGGTCGSGEGCSTTAVGGTTRLTVTAVADGHVEVTMRVPAAALGEVMQSMAPLLQRSE